jgi:uncharacterized protein YycO
MINLRFVTSNDHAEAVMPDGTLLGAHFSGGVQIRPKGYDAAIVKREEIVSLPCSDAVEQSFLDFLKSQIGKPYDFEAIAALVIERNWRSPESWFCSELQTAALERAGYLLPLAADVAKITPRDLLILLSARVPVNL